MSQTLHISLTDSRMNLANLLRILMKNFQGCETSSALLEENWKLVTKEAEKSGYLKFWSRLYRIFKSSEWDHLYTKIYICSRRTAENTYYFLRQSNYRFDDEKSKGSWACQTCRYLELYWVQLIRNKWAPNWVSCDRRVVRWCFKQRIVNAKA